MLADSAIIRNVSKSWTIRDIPDDVVAGVDAAALTAGARSREAFVREFLQMSFGSTSSVNSGIAFRARSAVEESIELGRFGALQPTPTVPRIARALSHPDASKLEGELRGNIPFSFSDVDRLCSLLGLSRDWLDAGEANGPRYGTTSQYFDCSTLLESFLAEGITYANLYFVLADAENGNAAILGQTSSDDPHVGWRYNLLVDEIPVHDQVGGTGRAQRRELADLLVALEDDDIFEETPFLLGRVVPNELYMGLVNGYLHPASVVHTSYEGGSRPVARRSDWHGDFSSFRRGEPHTKSYAIGRAALLEDLRQRRITNDEQYRAAIRKEVKSWNVAARNAPH